MTWLDRLMATGPHTCPWWLGYSFDNPLRRLVHDPDAVLGGYVAPGQTVVDVGCGLGYFTLALARRVGPEGRVIAVDLQPQMTRRAQGRAVRQGLDGRIEFRTCAPDRLGVTTPAHFVLAFWVVHEMVNPAGFFDEVRSLLRPDGRLLVAEPKGHVPLTRFQAIADLAGRAGFEACDGPPVRLSRSILCTHSASSPIRRANVRP